MARTGIAGFLLKLDPPMMYYAISCQLAGVFIGAIIGGILFWALASRVPDMMRVYILAGVCGGAGFVGFFWGFIRAFKAKDRDLKLRGA